MLIHLLTTLATLATATSPISTSTDAFSQAARSLDERAECTPFRWEDDGNGNTRAAISVPVELNGRALRFQFDTGADTNILYGSTADTAGWSTASDTSFRPQSFKLGSATFDRPYTHLLRNMPADEIHGTLGLQALIGRVTVIDYPGQRLCLFKEADLPRAIGAAATFVPGALHDGKFFVSAQVGRETWRDIMFDTGSSAMPLTVDLARWKTVTGKATTEAATNRIAGQSWGKPVSFAGAPLTDPFVLGGKIGLERPLAYTKSDAPERMAKSPFPLDAILGNAPLTDGIVVLILTGRSDFGFIAPPRK